MLALNPWPSAYPGQDALYNPEAVVPPQCYTKHEARFNPCYMCHQSHDGRRLNAMDDQRLQVEYDFADVALRNHWTGLFVDRRPLIEAISDDQVLAYIRNENYSALAARLQAAGWKGYVPRLRGLENAAAAFDDSGLARDGSGWVAFNYKPLPSTFWPTNGSTDDVMIRLPERFRQTAQGQADERIYFLNLALVEIAIKDLAQIPIAPADERALGVDLDGDGRLETQVQVLARKEHYLGGAANDPVPPFLYPQGTEFLHTVRYIDHREGEGIAPASRMKELRYMRKHTLLSPEEVKQRYRALNSETEEDDGEVQLQDRGDLGFDNGFGWYVQGFIEAADGALRPQSHEEGLFCMGCHRSIGATIDHTFAFARKVTGPEGWGYIDLRGMPDAPSVADGKAEILQYFQRVGGGDEFRENPELRRKFFRGEHQVMREKVGQADVHELITPSRERALALNKAHWTIVRAQRYIRGRDANLAPMRNVHREVDPQTAPVLPPELRYRSDIRLDWSGGARQAP